MWIVDEPKSECTEEWIDMGARHDLVSTTNVKRALKLQRSEKRERTTAQQANKEKMTFGCFQMQLKHAGNRDPVA
jgi:hypothetical protein